MLTKPALLYLDDSSTTAPIMPSNPHITQARVKPVPLLPKISPGRSNTILMPSAMPPLAPRLAMPICLPNSKTPRMNPRKKNPTTIKLRTKSVTPEGPIEFVKAAQAKEPNVIKRCECSTALRTTNRGCQANPNASS